ncbi:MAG: hypothetical protein CSA72_00290 [Rhodobacterales bacterium]|nr:MAG: hypothetical protein CSA72_00290 [Rhodobacterales bacterium]
MRVLIYIEPHPIRDEYTIFNAIARRFLPLLGLQNGIEFRLYANGATFERIGISSPEGDTKRFIAPLEEDEALLERHFKPWDKAGMPDWLDLMAGTGIARDYEALLERIWLRYRFDAVLYWGENGAVRNFCRTNGIMSMGMELGCTRAPFVETIAPDLLGTNGSAVPAQLSVSDLEEITGGQGLSAPDALAMFSRAETGDTWRAGFDLVAPPDLRAFLDRGRIAVLPLQLYDDANLLRFSPYGTVRDVVLDVVPKLAEAGWNVVVKPHPASAVRGAAVTENRIARDALAPWSDHLFWYEGSETTSATLMSLADLVVTVNSSVGFEALFYDRPVVVMGDAVYKPKGLFPTLDDVVREQVDWTAYARHAALLRQFMLGGYLQPDVMLRSRALLERQVLLHWQLHRDGKTPREIAQAVYDANCHVSLARGRLHALHALETEPAAKAPAQVGGVRSAMAQHGGAVGFVRAALSYLRRHGWAGVGHMWARLKRGGLR